MSQPPSSFVRRLLEWSGMLEPRGCRCSILYSMFAVYSLLACAYSVGGCVGFIIINGTPIQKLQSVGIGITILNGLIKHANAYFNQTKMASLLDSFDWQWDLLYENPENRSLLDPVKRKCTKLFRFLVAVCSMIIFLNGMVPIILYFILGVDHLYFQILMPMEGRWHFIPTHILQFLLTVSPFLTNSSHNYLYFALSQQLGSYIAILRKRLREETLSKDIIKAHQDVIKLTRQMNDQFAHLLYFETNTIAVECSCSAYIVYKVNIENGNLDSLSVNMISFAFCYFIPYIICYCGSIIKNESDEILNDSFSGPWVESERQARQNLRLVMLAAREPLTLHYRNLAVFSMELFLGILNGTYTFLNAIVWLEKAGEKTAH